MGFWEHFDELREKLVKCVWIFFLGFIAFYFLSDRILDLLRKPLFDALPEAERHLYYTNLFENFLVHLKVSAYASLLAFSPAYFYIIWSFIAPGLKEKERKHLKPFIVAAAFFFLVGASFAYFVLFPKGVKYFLSYGTAAEVPLLTLDSYISLILKLMTGFGLCFEIPVVLILLGKLGVLTSDILSKQRRTAVIVITIIAAFVAPPDAMSMVLLMAPLYLLYESSILILRRLEKKNGAKNPIKS